MSQEKRDLGLHRLLKPRSVAVVGATDDPTKIGRRIIPNLVGAGFSGAIYPVNPRASVVAGWPACASPAELPPGVDVAYVLVPADRVVDTVAQCAQRGVGFAIVAAAGFAETPGAEGKLRQEALVELCRRHSIRIVGPNCNGLYNVTDGVSIGFNTAHGRRLSPGPLGVLSHSGALFASLAQRCTDMSVGISKFVSVGNEADLDILDFFEHLLDDPCTTIIGLVLDGVPDGDRFAHLCRKARARSKLVLALRFGESEVGAQAATAHSSRLAGSTNATNALFDHLGVGRVTSVEALVASAAMLSVDHVTGRRGAIGAWTMSGAAGSLLADAASRHLLPLADFAPETTATLDALASTARIVNPVDAGALRGIDAWHPALQAVAADPGVDDLVATPHDMGGREQNLPAMEALVEARRRSNLRLTVLVPGGLDGVEDDLRAAGIVLLRDTVTAMEALAAARTAERPLAPPSARSAVPPIDVPMGADGGLTLSEPRSLKLLGQIGVPTVRWRQVSSTREAVAAAADLGGTVAVKGVVPGVAHKSELGLVRLGIESSDGAAEAYESVREAVDRQGGGDVIVQEMVLGGRVELIVGLTRDESLGHLVVVGLGGVFAEEIGQTVMVPVAAGRDEVWTVLSSAPVGRVLASPRWMRTPREAVLDVVEALQVLALGAGDVIASVDINPLIVRDGSVIAADALVVRSSAVAPIEGSEA